MSRILVVDDESQLLRALRITLRARAYDVETAPDGAAALAAVARRPPDVVVLDLGLPDIDGIEVITGLRGWTQVPIIVLSGRADAADKVEALDAGADDYVTKPFNMDELLARIRAVLRHHTADAPAQITLGDHTVDLSAHRITRRTPTPAQPGASVEPAVHLTPTEWKILAVLARHPGALVESQRLLTEVWGPRYRTETDHLRFHIAQLRRKLEPDPTRPTPATCSPKPASATATSPNPSPAHRDHAPLELRIQHICYAPDSGQVTQDALIRAQIEQDAYVAGYRLAELRGKAGMTQTQLAEVMGVSQARVSAMERGELDTLTVASVRAYITALGGTVKIVASLDDTDVTLRLPGDPHSTAA